MKICFKCKQHLAPPIIYGLHQTCFFSEFDCAKVTEFMELDPKKDSISTLYTEIRMHKNTFFHGRYLKYSARLGEVQYILKVEEKQYPELPFVEYLCNQMAEQLKIEVPPHHLIDFNGRVAFVTRNFMQDYTGTLLHIYRFLQPGDESYNCEEIISAILAQTERLADVSKFIEICLFDALIGNNDRHGRNLGIIQTASTKKIAPMYDNPSCIGIEQEFFLKSDINPSGCIWTKDSKYPKATDYIIEFQRLGYESVVKQFVRKIISKASSILSLIECAMLSPMRKDALTKLILKRLKEFEHVS